MLVGAGGYLWQMGYGQYLSALPELAHEFAYGVRYCAAYASIYVGNVEWACLPSRAGGNGYGERGAG